ncbi:hypothetical protein K456DRAFT_42840 [Colletotrichum gloeosporioides 23]|nr:hypothetical protein K456DRAFT_42840 [Colletotrichum gloeosporioides 23]
MRISQFGLFTEKGLYKQEEFLRGTFERSDLTCNGRHLHTVRARRSLGSGHIYLINFKKRRPCVAGQELSPMTQRVLSSPHDILAILVKLRSKTTCYQCRARKVRCQGWPNGCTACKRLGYRCSFEATSLTSDPTPTQLERRRGERACSECRAQKIKCSGESPTCAGCRRRGRDCEYPEAKRRRSQTQTNNHWERSPFMMIPRKPMVPTFQTPQSLRVLQSQVLSISSNLDETIIRTHGLRPYQLLTHKSN